MDRNGRGHCFPRSDFAPSLSILKQWKVEVFTVEALCLTHVYPDLTPGTSKLLMCLGFQVDEHEGPAFDERHYYQCCKIMETFLNYTPSL